MFHKAIFRTLVVLLVALLLGCTERPDISRVEQDFSDLKSMLIPLDEIYEKCSFRKTNISTKKEQGKGDEWEVFEMHVKVACGSEEKEEKVRILYEYVVDFKDHAGPYWELAGWGYDRPFQNIHYN